MVENTLLDAEVSLMPPTKLRSAKPTNAVAPTAVSSPAPAERAEVLTLAEAAAYLRVGEATILQAVHEQGLPARQLGADWRFLKSALQDWLGLCPRKNQSLLAHLGGVRDDPYLEEMLTEIYQRRGRPETEEG
jgi:excisionase family DNA binding protein